MAKIIDSTNDPIHVSRSGTKWIQLTIGPEGKPGCRYAMLTVANARKVAIALLTEAEAQDQEPPRV